MRARWALGLFAAAAALGTGGPASSQGKPSVAVMPTQYFSATSDSAGNVTTGLAQQFEGQGYSVVSSSKAADAFRSEGLDASRHYADSVALKFGRAAGADLVVYPRLLAVGLPPRPGVQREGTIISPNAVILVRVLNVRTGQPIYCRQVGHEFGADTGEYGGGSTYNLPQPIATATAQEVLQHYFQTVANSRLEAGRGR